MATTANIDHHTKTIEDVTFTNIHSGQKRAYGDSLCEYEAVSDQSPEHVRAILCEHAYKCELPAEQWRAENREKPSMDNHFRSHYEFKNLGDGKYFYRVTFPFSD